MPRLPRRTLAPALALALLATGASAAAAAPAGPAPLSVQPSSLDFGVVHVNWGEQTNMVWVQNTGLDPLQLSSATVDGSPAFRVNGDGCAGQLLGSGQGCNVGVGFDPGDGTAYAGTLRVPAPGFDDLLVPLAGVGGVQQVTLAPQALAFGEVAVGTSVTRSFTLTSDGTIPFQSFVTLPTGGDVGAFRVEHDSCSLQQLVPGQPCTVSVRFTPLAAGEATARLLLIGGESEPAAVPLHGIGTAPPAAVSPASPPPAPAVPTARRVAEVAFDALASRPARVAHGRIDLGRARCASSKRCAVTVRPRLYALGADDARISRVRGDVVLWRLQERGTPATLAVPAGLRGRPALLVARLRIRAAGQADGTRTLIVRLAPAGRRPHA